jgi:hypothetical protein
MASIRTKSMGQACSWTVDATGPQGKPSSAAHGLLPTSRNATLCNDNGVHLESVG